MLSAVSSRSKPGFQLLTRIQPLTVLFIPGHSFALRHDHHSLTSGSTRLSTVIKPGSGHGGAFRSVPAFVSTYPLHLSQVPRAGMELKQRRAHSTSENSKVQEPGQQDKERNGHAPSVNGHSPRAHEHNHSFPIFGHSHSHHEEHAWDAEKIIEALKGTG
jgi:hypothetical protein